MRQILILTSAIALTPMCGADFFGQEQQLIGLWEHPFEDHFTIGDLSGTWSKAERYAAEWRLVDTTDERLSPWGGVHIGWDERNGDFTKGGEIEVQALVLALTGGGAFHLFKEDRQARLDPTLSIFGRGGIGFQDGRIKDFPLEDYPGFNPGDVGSGDLSPIRYEFGIGFEGSIVVARKLIFTAGVGTTWWFANESTSVIISNGGSAVAVSASYAGGEIWSHLGLGVNF